jgi:hypothetical protein
MIRARTTAMMIVTLIPISLYAANAFLGSDNDTPVSASFRGKQWGDELGEEEIPLSVRVVTTRIARMDWGTIFKIEFTDVTSGASKPAGVRPKKREIRSEYFVVTENRIVLLNEEDNDAAAKKISALNKPPDFKRNDIYGIASGSFEEQEGEWKTTIKLKGDLCICEASHPSGHFKNIVWKKGIGLVEYASGYGAHADGYRLKREATSRK